MIRSASLAAITILVVALLTTIKVEEHRLATERSRAAEAILTTTNLAAERDSTRNLALENANVAALLSDSLHLVEKQVVQVAQRSDALDRALGSEHRGSYAMSVTTDSGRAVALAPISVDTVDVRRASFAIRQPPFTIRADVGVPGRTDSAQLSLSIALDPVHLNARLICSPPNAQGVRTASILAASPKWAIVHFDRVEQSPALCASPALGTAQQSRPGFRFPSFVLGAGRVISPNAPLSWGVFVGIGTSIGG